MLTRTISEEKKEEKIFLAGLQGVDLTKAFGDPEQDRRKEIERRAAERLGKGKKYEADEFAEIGIMLISDEG